MTGKINTFAWRGYFCWMMYHFLQVWAEYSGNLVVNGGLGDASVVCRGLTGQRGCNGEPWLSFGRDRWFIVNMRELPCSKLGYSSLTMDGVPPFGLLVSRTPKNLFCVWSTFFALLQRVLGDITRNCCNWVSVAKNFG